MVIKTILIIAVIAILMEDGSSIRKTEEEKQEEEDVAKAVNRTLAEEEKKRKEEEDEKKRKEERKSKGRTEDPGRQEGQGQTCVTPNVTCPVVKCPAPVECDPCAPCGPCPEEKVCPAVVCGPCPEVDPCQPCGPCPEVKPCQPCRPCKPCGPCPTLNRTSLPEMGNCPETDGSSMTVPVALLVGVTAGVLVTGVAAAVGLLLRYVPPVTSGFVFLATIVIVWYFSSQHPEVARELGGRAAALVREAAVALGHRVMAAIQCHQEQVGFPV
jgi:hypothetical protein